MGLDADGDDRPAIERERSAVWGRRAYVDKRAKEILNDVSFDILLHEPAHVEDAANPSLSEVLEHHYRHDRSKAPTLTDLLSRGLSYQEAVVWYFFRFCGMTIMDIYYATSGHDTGGGVQDRRNATRNIRRVLHEAADTLGEDISVPEPGDIPDTHDLD